MMEEVTYVWNDRKRNFLGLPWTFTKYALTQDRLFITTGLLKTEEDEVRLYRILDITKSKTLWQKIFSMGTIKVSSADKSLGNFELKNVKKVDEVKEMLSRLVEECRDKKRVANREFMGDDLDALDEDV
jgi:Predicted membrane protein